MCHVGSRVLNPRVVKWGVPIGQTFPPAGSFEEHDVVKNRRRIHTYPPSPAITYVCACGHPPPTPDIPVLTTIPARPHPGTHGAPKPVGSFTGNPLDARTSAWLPPDAPPSAAGGRLNLVGGRLWVPCCGSAMGWWPGSRGPRACTWPPGRVSGGSCGMAVDGREIVVNILRTLPQPSTAIPQVPRRFPATSSSKITYVTG